jgi:serine/threonine protein kinase
VIDIAAVQREFSSLTDLTPLSSPSGQKEVIKARHPSGTVVLKLVKQPAAFDKRTEREISAVKKIGGSYIPRIIEFGRKNFGGEDHFFIIEQFIEGETYRDMLHREPIQPIQAVLRLADALLHACHDFEVQRIVHRDIKPENLIIDVDGKIWVLDFGLARHLSLQSITPDGLYAGVGTLGYAAPEQFQNIKAEINASGTWLNVRSFALDKFYAPGPEDTSRRTTWYYCSEALSEFKIEFLDIALRQGVLTAMAPPPTLDHNYAAPLFAGAAPTSVAWGEQNAFRHYLTSLRSQAADASEGSFTETIAQHNRTLDRAEALLRTLHSKGVRGQDRDFGQIIDVNRAALAVFSAAREQRLARAW